MSFDNNLTTTALTDGIIRELRRKLGLVTYFAKLGDSDGGTDIVATIDEPGLPGLVRVRIENDTVPYRTVKSGVLGAYLVYPGSPVIVGYDEKDELAIKSADHDALRELPTGNPLILNSADTRVAGFYQTDSLLPLWCGAVGTADTPSTKVAVGKFRYVDEFGELHEFVDTQIELAGSIPGATEHRYVALFLKTDDTVEITASTAQDTSLPLTDDDKQECFDASTPRARPIWLLRLHEAQTAVVSSDKVEDLRNWQSPLTRVNNFSATIAPTVNDDIDLRYEVGSWWFDTTNDKAYVCLDSTDGAAIWRQMSAEGYSTIANIDDTDSPYSPGPESNIIADTTGGDITINLPAVATSDERQYTIKNVGTGTVTIDPAGVETIDGSTTLIVNAQYDAPKIICDGTEWWII